MTKTERLIHIGVVGVALLLIFALPSHAQWLNYKLATTPRTPDGKPDLNAPAPKTPEGKPDFSGVWRVNGYQYNIGKDLKPGEIDMLPRAKALYEQRRKSNSFDNPWAQCYPGGVPRAWLSPDPFKILYMPVPKVTVVLFEAVQTWRQIFTDGRGFPNDPDPTYNGYSIGHWDGDTFVVETTGFHDNNWIDSAGMPGSDALKVTERFRRKDFGHMDVAVTIDDPKMYSKPWTVILPFTPYPDDELVEYVCNENNRYPVSDTIKPGEIR